MLDLLHKTDVSFFARRGETRDIGRSAGLTACESIRELAEKCELIFIAVPVDQSYSVIEELMPWLRSGQVVSDVGSTKASVLKWTANQPWPEGVTFIGGHPMAGTDIAGFRGSNPGLFHNKSWVLTTDGLDPPRALDPFLLLLEVVIMGLGGRVVVMDAQSHDWSVAYVSHLEHIVSLALVEMVRQSPKSSLLASLAAGSFKDATRVSMSSPEMVIPFLTGNKFLPEAIQSLEHSLRLILQELGKLDVFDFRWNRAAQWRRELDIGRNTSETVTVSKSIKIFEFLEQTSLSGRAVTSILRGRNQIVFELS